MCKYFIFYFFFKSRLQVNDVMIAATGTHITIPIDPAIPCNNSMAIESLLIN